MSFSTSLPRKSSPPRSAPAVPSVSERPVLTVEGARAISQLEHAANLGRMSANKGDTPTLKQGVAAMGVTAMQLGAASMLSPLRSHAHSSDALSVSSVPPLKLSVGKRLSQFFKGDHKTKDSIAIPAVTTAPF
ncbi:hypothetical protein BGX33_007198, partial [Mortierella sp. NVP41]